MGPVILDLIGTELNQEEKELLQHPHVGGIILFTRNYHDPEQLVQLCRSIRLTRKSPLLITVDHEGGRVQRFRDGFTRLPSMGQIGATYKDKPDLARRMAESCGWIMAAELLAVGIDLSFAPVLDLNKDNNPAIGDRGFDSDPAIIAELAKAVVRGMNSAGMAATGKHFPGHGSVNLDSHKTIPVDSRTLKTVTENDMRPFAELIKAGIQAIMPAHIIFPEIDKMPVGFSPIWLQDILRKQLQFSGVIFSDDLNMEGAGFVGGYLDRAVHALDAGCDMVLICNNPAGAIQIIDRLPEKYKINREKFNRLQGRFQYEYKALQQVKMWKENSNAINTV